VQLSVLGYVLVPIFTFDAWWLTAIYTAFMLAVAAVEAVSRPSHIYSGMLLQVCQHSPCPAPIALFPAAAATAVAARLLLPPWACGRPLRGPAARAQVLLAMGVGTACVITYGLAVVVGVRPWYQPQYLIPMLGMLLGNACSGVAIGLSTVLDELVSGKRGT
jgi:putative ABC transport system permease protein